MNFKNRKKMVKAVRIMALLLIVAMIATYSIQIFAYLM